jgi:hypothetical protein
MISQTFLLSQVFLSWIVQFIFLKIYQAHRFSPLFPSSNLKLFILYLLMEQLDNHVICILRHGYFSSSVTILLLLFFISLEIRKDCLMQYWIFNWLILREKNLFHHQVWSQLQYFMFFYYMKGVSHLSLDYWEFSLSMRIFSNVFIHLLTLSYHSPYWDSSCD